MLKSATQTSRSHSTYLEEEKQGMTQDAEKI